jgi:predicted  nucleic acid-binding Zn-ribbon protein
VNAVSKTLTDLQARVKKAENDAQAAESRFAEFHGKASAAATRLREAEEAHAALRAKVYA